MAKPNRTSTGEWPARILVPVLMLAGVGACTHAPVVASAGTPGSPGNTPAAQSTVAPAAGTAVSVPAATATPTLVVVTTAREASIYDRLPPDEAYTGGETSGFVMPRDVSFLLVGAMVQVDGQTKSHGWNWLYVLVRSGSCRQGYTGPQADCAGRKAWLMGSDVLGYEDNTPMAPPIAPDIGTPNATQRVEATLYGPALTVVAGSGVDIYSAKSTVVAALHATPTPTPVPIPVEVKNQHWVFTDEAGLREAQQTYEAYLDLVLARQGPPPADYAAQIGKYMVQRPAGYSANVPGSCTYGDVVNHIGSLLKRQQYVRLANPGKWIWDQASYANPGVSYALSLKTVPALQDQVFYYTFSQPVHLPDNARFELVDIASGKVIESKTAYSGSYHEPVIVYQNGWRVPVSIYCTELNDVGLWH